VEAIEPTAIAWPYARSLLCVQSSRGSKHTPGTPERRYYLSSFEPQERDPAAWARLIRNHWGGVEIRNHWRKDACWGEDRTRSRNPNIVGALALLRNGLLALVTEHLDTYGSMPAFFEACQHRPSFALRLIRGSL
jgi:predicted transposase YbfD/YdcC